jgi:hypothetical protein
VELAEDNYSEADIPEIIAEREGNFETGYVVNLLPVTVRRVLALADHATPSDAAHLNEIEFIQAKYKVGYQMAEIMAKATKEGA